LDYGSGEGVHAFYKHIGYFMFRKNNNDTISTNKTEEYQNLYFQIGTSTGSHMKVNLTDVIKEKDSYKITSIENSLLCVILT